MLDLKAKLAAAGLVTKKDVEQVEAQQAKAKARKRSRKSSSRTAPPNRSANSNSLAAERKALDPTNRNECYAATRRWVERRRLDQQIPGDNTAAFHFTTHQGKLSRLFVTADVKTQLERGAAAITAFMSNHGLAHAVVPRSVALEIHALFPLWLRVLTGHDDAGKLEQTPQKSE